MKVDFHTHTSYSYDCYMSPKKLLKTAEKKGLDAIAITDHDSMEVFNELKRNNNYGSKVKVIKGCEFKTPQGDVIVLFLDKMFKFANMKEFYNEVKKQNGLIIIPHPFKENKSFRFNNQNKILEILNGRIKPHKNIRAKRYVQRHNLIGTSGSDAHTSFELGKIYNKFNCENIKELKELLIARKFKVYGSENQKFVVYLSKVIGAYKKRGLLGLIKRVLR
jgi:predicted metal-dependent phosphoesterase TrpH